MEYGRVLLGRGVPESVILDWCHDLEVKVPISISTRKGDSNEDQSGFGSGTGTRTGSGSAEKVRHSPSSSSSFYYQNPFELVQNLDAKECSDKLIGLYDYELFGATSDQQSNCCKCS